MKLLFLLILICGKAGGLTLEEAQRLAIENSPSLKTIRAEVEARDATLLRSDSRFYPRLGVESRLEYFDSRFERRSGGTGNVFAEWNLFNGFQDYSARKTRRIERDQAQVRLEIAEKSVHWDVETSFYKVIALQKSIELYNAALKRNDDNLKAARSRRAAGVVSEADVLEFNLYESILRADLAATESRLKQVQSELRTLTGQDQIVFPLSGSTPKYKLQSDIKDLLEGLPGANADIRIDQLEVERAGNEKRLAQGGFLPDVRVFASHGSLGLRETQISPETYAGLVARWELFSGLDTLGAHREAAARIAQAETALRSTQIAKKGELEQVYVQLKALEYRIQLEEQNHEMAHRYLRTVADEYRRGVKNSPDLKTANDNVLQSHLREVSLFSEYIAQAGVLKAMTQGQAKFEVLKVLRKVEE